MLSTFLNVLARLWHLPVLVLTWLFYYLPLWVLGYIYFFKWYDNDTWLKLPVFIVTSKDCWYRRLWKTFRGQSFGLSVVLLDEKYASTSIMVHEHQHGLDQAYLGVFFYLLYGAHMLILAFQPEKSSYRDNYFEIKARKAAGQRV